MDHIGRLKMSLYDEKKKNDQLILEHGLYEKAVVELETDLLDKGSWGKALVEANGDEVIARGLYIKHRVQILKDHIEADILRKEKAREDAERAKEAAARAKALKEKQRIEAEAELQKILNESMGNPSIAISKLKVAKGVRLAQDLVDILGIEKSEGESGTFFLVRNGSIKHSNLQDALLEHISKFGFE